MDFQQCNVMMRDDIRFSAVKLEVCPDSKSESYVQWLPVLLIGIVIFLLLNIIKVKKSVIAFI